MQTSSGAKVSASGSRTRRFSFRRACEWSLARHRAPGGQGHRQGSRGTGARRGGQRAGARGGVGGAQGLARGGGPPAARCPPPARRRRVPTTGPCGMLYWRSTAASSASDRTA